MGTFLILLLLFVVVIPAIRAAVAVMRARRQYRDMFNMFRGTADAARQQQSQQQHQRRRGGWTSPEATRKKIDPNVGEYVEFEEIACNTTAHTTDRTADRHTRVETEQQIVDAEWEDIK